MEWGKICFREKYFPISLQGSSSEQHQDCRHSTPWISANWKCRDEQSSSSSATDQQQSSSCPDSRHTRHGEANQWHGERNMQDTHTKKWRLHQVDSGSYIDSLNDDMRDFANYAMTRRHLEEATMRQSSRWINGNPSQWIMCMPRVK